MQFHKQNKMNLKKTDIKSVFLQNYAVVILKRRLNMKNNYQIVKNILKLKGAFAQEGIQKRPIFLVFFIWLKINNKI